ncbi:hypothetical protein [Bradyrhizobium sp. RT10b]|uniref:hypothetical protein n=1 Tax=unclassified Bradyrhizobium TaxID=2631580 RepID=UPI0033990ED9
MRTKLDAAVHLEDPKIKTGRPERLLFLHRLAKAAADLCGGHFSAFFPSHLGLLYAGEVKWPGHARSRPIAGRPDCLDKYICRNVLCIRCKRPRFLTTNAPCGGAYVYGRSDSTLNRFGVRIGSAEIYRVLEQIPEIADALVICCEMSGGEFYMPPFVALKAGLRPDGGLKDRIAGKLRTDASPRHVPDEIIRHPPFLTR